MIPGMVADVGNTRVKWGIVSAEGTSIIDVLSLEDDPDAWRQALDRIASCLSGRSCVVASVRPERSERLTAWLTAQGFEVRRLHRPEDLPLKIAVVEPRRVGIDRLLNAVAALTRLKRGEPAVLVDAGSAVTVDWLDESHTFRGGTIFPGLRLMAEALHAYTALLPLVKVELPIPDVPAPDTIPAMQAGIFHAVVGGIDRIARIVSAQSQRQSQLFITGGDAPLLTAALPVSPLPVYWPAMTLEGILYTALASDASRREQDLVE